MSKIPNLLTCIRLALVPVFILLIFFCQSENHIIWAFFVFIIATITDFLDGYLARKWKVISDFGKIADPLADKLIVLSALAALTFLPPYKLFVLIFIVIALREIVITIMREILKKQGIVMPADKLGKWKTSLQMIGIILALFLWAWFPEIALKSTTRLIANIWFSLVALLTVYSGLNYLKLLPKLLKKGE
ncbi:MAG: CDP-diacylglycerol--glycerol-3-phosphate 3-phosphatidyltransferase [Candidatus Cloacimonadaceae bacterium]|jgi:CDP-diacylglycerol--glycerol-3-phosphate 3-phosphatidyltransferase|nr:CDP-diacylglycerol--glycerol-3-phosphate 3-phosphatidyltransferase [Candidatus Cloacimonadota bacterium]MDY0111339.1 CDP-diacylglycerol--glycerol-3-phosphate 3-phosphatidyltransferase [Candidatus Syntrophosphaera sp.]